MRLLFSISVVLMQVLAASNSFANNEKTKKQNYLNVVGQNSGPVISSVNQLIIKQPHKKNEYSFLVGGHLYGSAKLTQSAFPASSLLGGIDHLISLGASFFISLGDNYRTPSQHEIALFRKSFLDRLKLPVFIAPGNHDGPGSSHYKDEFGPTYSAFRIRSELFILLNTEFPNGDLIGKQKEFLLEILNMAASDNDIKNIFLFSHKLIWAAGRAKYEPVISNVNARTQYQYSKFATQILPALKQAAETKNIYWGSGDIGNPPSFGLFFERDESDGITYFAVGLGDVREDTVLLVRLSPSGRVGFEAISLNASNLRPLHEYNLEFWQTRYEFFATMQRKVQRVIKHSYFKYGIYVGVSGGSSLFGILVLIFWLRKRRGR